MIYPRIFLDTHTYSNRTWCIIISSIMHLPGGVGLTLLICLMGSRRSSRGGVDGFEGEFR